MRRHAARVSNLARAHISNYRRTSKEHHSVLPAFTAWHLAFRKWQAQSDCWFQPARLSQSHLVCYSAIVCRIRATHFLMNQIAFNILYQFGLHGWVVVIVSSNFSSTIHTPTPRCVSLRRSLWCQRNHKPVCIRWIVISIDELSFSKCSRWCPNKRAENVGCLILRFVSWASTPAVLSANPRKKPKQRFNFPCQSTVRT